MNPEEPAGSRADEERQVAGLAPHRLHRVLAHIDAEFTKRLTVADLAAQAFISPFHFARLFKMAIGESPHRYIVLKRIAFAKQLLAGSDLPIADIARTTGYKTQAHFTGAFRDIEGTTPAAYRRAQRAAALRTAPSPAAPVGASD
jgi:AraC family transcriptional regulator